jgi:hypothetical protein
MVALAGSLALAQAPEGRGGGQRGAAPPEPHNLKVLPASTTTANILPIMRNFAAALGTNCGYCHVWTGPGLPTNDYASDEKPAKEVARVMMRMATGVNEQLAAAIKKPPISSRAAVHDSACPRRGCHPDAAPPRRASRRALHAGRSLRLVAESTPPSTTQGTSSRSRSGLRTVPFVSFGADAPLFRQVARRPRLQLSRLPARAPR